MTLRNIKVIIKKFCQIHGIDRHAGVLSDLGCGLALAASGRDDDQVHLPLIGSALLEKGTLACRERPRYGQLNRLPVESVVPNVLNVLQNKSEGEEGVVRSQLQSMS